MNLQNQATDLSWRIQNNERRNNGRGGRGRAGGRTNIGRGRHNCGRGGFQPPRNDRAMQHAPYHRPQSRNNGEPILAETTVEEDQMMALRTITIPSSLTTEMDTVKGMQVCQLTKGMQVCQLTIMDTDGMQVCHLILHMGPILMLSLIHI